MEQGIMAKKRIRRPLKPNPAVDHDLFAPVDPSLGKKAAFGLRLRKLMAFQGYDRNDAELARVASKHMGGGGIGRWTINNWKHGKNMPDPFDSALRAVSIVLKCAPSYL